MKLFFSPTSPFVRKVTATAIAAGLHDRIERVTTDPWASPAELLAQNPLSKVPCLVTDDGLALYDSPVICEYLADLGGGALMPSGADRWRVLKQQAAADGILDASIIRRREAMRPQEEARSQNMERQREIMRNGLSALEADPPGDAMDLGTISIACMLGFLDLRFPEEPWRDAHPALESWFARFSKQPALAQTAPPAA